MREDADALICTLMGKECPHGSVFLDLQRRITGRNPLQPMVVAAALLNHPSEKQRHEQALKILKRQMGFMERLVEDLVDLTRVSEAKLQLDYETVELKALVNDAVESCRDQAETRPVTLACVVPSAGRRTTSFESPWIARMTLAQFFCTSVGAL